MHLIQGSLATIASRSGPPVLRRLVFPQHGACQSARGVRENGYCHSMLCFSKAAKFNGSSTRGC